MSLRKKGAWAAIATDDGGERLAGSAGKIRTGTVLKGIGAALFIEPHVFEPPAVVHAVDHRGETPDGRTPAGGAAHVIQHGPGALLLQRAVDVPDQLLALRRVGLR